MARFIIALIVVFGCTFGIFALLFPILFTELFWADLLVTWLAEAILLANVPMLTSDSTLSIQKAVGGLWLNICAIALIVWMLIYNFGLKDEVTFPLFIVGILAIICLCFIVGYMTTATAEASEKRQVVIDNTIATKHNYKAEISDYAFRTQKLLRAATFDGAYDVAKAYSIVVDKASTVPASILETKQNETEKIMLLLSDIYDASKEQEWTEEKITALSDLIEELKIKVTQIK